MSTRGVWLHALLVPVALGAFAGVLHASGVDVLATDRFFDPQAGRFPWRSVAWLELIGHGLARSAAVLLWFAVVASAIVASLIDGHRPSRRLLWSIAAAMALGPMVVVALKELTAFPCPWNLRRYGGFAIEPSVWFVAPSAAGRCFPSGHSAGGFSLVAFYFAALSRQRSRPAALALGATVIAGMLFSAVRLMQGAHFISHAIWSAAIDWLCAALIFLPAMLHARVALSSAATSGAA